MDMEDWRQSHAKGALKSLSSLARINTVVIGCEKCKIEGFFVNAWLKKQTQESFGWTVETFK